MANNASATRNAPRLSAEAVAAIERILAHGGKAEIIPGDKALIVKEVTRKTVCKSALT